MRTILTTLVIIFAAGTPALINLSLPLTQESGVIISGRDCPLVAFLSVDISNGWRATVFYTKGEAMAFSDLRVTVMNQAGEVLIGQSAISEGLPDWMTLLDSNRRGYLDVGDSFIVEKAISLILTIEDLNRTPVAATGACG